MNEIKAQIERFEAQTEEEKIIKRKFIDTINELDKKFLTREVDQHLTSSAIILNPTLDQMLMVHHHIYRTWTWTGGHVDGERDLLEVAIREAKEETGLKEITPLSTNIFSLEILPVVRHEKQGKMVPEHLHYNATFVLIASTADKIYPKEDENSGVRWVEVEEIPIYSNEPELIKIYLNVIRKARASSC